MSDELAEHLRDAKTALLLLRERNLEDEQWREVDQIVAIAQEALETKDAARLRGASADLEMLASDVRAKTHLGKAPRAKVPDLTRDQINQLVDRIELHLGGR